MQDSNPQALNRIQGLDLIRAFAIICVLIVHTLDVAHTSYSLEDYNNLSTFSKAFYFGFYTIGRLGVPLFFFLTGYLLIPREYNHDYTKKFYRRNLLTLLITWEIWIPIYNWIAWWYYDVPFHFSTLIKNMLFIEHVYVLTTWYMPVILGIYLFIPYISRVLKSMSHREMLILLIVAYVYFFIVPTVYHLKTNPVNYTAVLDLSFSGGLYGFYVILGHIMKVYGQYLDKLSNRTAIFLILVAVALITEAQIWINATRLYRVWYDFFLQPIAAILIFNSLKSIKFNKLSSLILNISNCSFGMYLIHIIFIFVLSKYNLLNFIVINELRIIISFVITFILSFIAIMCLKKIPRLGKILVR